MSVWNVFKDRMLRLGDSVTVSLVESECKGTAKFQTTKLFAKKILKKNYNLRVNNIISAIYATIKVINR